MTEKTGDEVPNVGKFYDHSDGEFVWGQNLVYTFYTDEKTGYPLGFRLYEKDNDVTKLDEARQLVKGPRNARKSRPRRTCSTRGTVIGT